VDVVGVNRSERRVVFGKARWRSTPVTTADLNALIEKGLRWLRGDTSRWEVHYAFFGKRFGQIQMGGVDEGTVHMFTPQDIVS